MTEKQTTLAILVKCGMDPSSHQYLMEAITEELTRRRERMASLEAALRAWKRFAEECAHRKVMVPQWAALLNERAVEATESALSGGTSALDAVVADAVAKVTEERDALAAALEKRNIAMNQIWGRLGGWAEAFPSAEAFQECKSVINDCRDGIAPKAILSARDARMKAEGRREGLAMYAKHLYDMGYKGTDEILEQLAARAGEVRS